MDECLDVIKYDSSSALSSQYFGDVTLETLHMILDTQNLCISSEVEMLNALVLWAKKECNRQGILETTENLRKVSAGAVEKIRFLTMSAAEFGNGPCLSPMLTRDESFAIMVCLTSPSKISMPPTFSTSFQLRALPKHCIFTAPVVSRKEMLKTTGILLNPKLSLVLATKMK